MYPGPQARRAAPQKIGKGRGKGGGAGHSPRTQTLTAEASVRSAQASGAPILGRCQVVAPVLASVG